MDDVKLWELIHAERSRLVDILGSLSANQWQKPSLCQGWSVTTTGAHVLAGAEQTTGHFIRRFAISAFRFNRMVDVDARRLGALGSDAVLARLRAAVSATTHPPAPIVAMLGEVVAHGEDIRRPLGIKTDASEAAIIECLAA
jgi:uncharacterized protein (TIGR03083 family)